MRILKSLVVSVTSVAVLCCAPNFAWADGFEAGEGTALVTGTGKHRKGGGEPGSTWDGTTTSGSQFTGKYVPKSEYKKQMTAYQTSLKVAVTHNTQIDRSWDNCINNVRIVSCPRGTARGLPTDPNIRAAGKPAAAVNTAPALPPEYVAYVAVARLTLKAPTPGIGPSPDINRWNMAVVGYPMWLWAEGNTAPAPVSDSVYDLSVSLKARLVKVVFDMGDGTKVSCTNLNQKWHRGMKAAIPSPACGHTYTQPSLPEGNYTITANSIWAVDWTINGTTGTIPMYQTATTELPVGELQVLVR